MLTTMGLISSWTYPFRGILLLTSTPQLHRVVGRFLLSVTATSAATSCAWLFLFYRQHVQFISQMVGGPNVLAKLAAGLVVLAEATLPVYLLFNRRFEQLQGHLFDATLKLQQVTISQLSQHDKDALAAAVADRQQQREAAKAAAAAAWRSGGLAAKASQLLLGSITSVSGFAKQILLKPEPHEGLLVRKARCLTSAAVGAVFPPLLLVLALRDSSVAAMHLLGRYWDLKGVPHNDDARGIAAQRRAGQTRGFGLVAAGLSYVPLLNWLLGLSNMVGAALLVADMEKKQIDLFVAH